jgi:hypothetical protein
MNDFVSYPGRGCQYRIYTILDLVGLPKNLAEALRWDDPERQLQAHAAKGASTGGARPAPVYHGHGAGMLDEKVKNELLRFFQKLDRSLAVIRY